MEQIDPYFLLISLIGSLAIWQAIRNLSVSALARDGLLVSAWQAVLVVNILFYWWRNGQSEVAALAMPRDVPYILAILILAFLTHLLNPQTGE